MAEIVRTEIRTQRNYTINDPQEPTRVETTTVVTSQHGYGPVMIRDFVKALDAADAPDSALIYSRRPDGPLDGLVAKWTHVREEPEQAS